MWVKLRNNFFAGMAIILPAILTIFIIRGLFLMVNNRVIDPILKIVEPYLRGVGIIYFKYTVKVLILFGVISVIILIGLATKSIIISRLISFGERLLYRIPLLNKIYTSVRQITHAFLARGRGLFQRVVLVEYPRKGIYSLGFVTSDASGEVPSKTSQDLLNVFVPTTPNPTSGVILMVPKESVVELEMSVEDGLKLVISGGTVTPPYKGDKKSG